VHKHSKKQAYTDKSNSREKKKKKETINISADDTTEQIEHQCNLLQLQLQNKLVKEAELSAYLIIALKLSKLT